MGGAEDVAMASEVEREDDETSAAKELLRDRFRLCTISIAEAEGRFSIQMP